MRQKVAQAVGNPLTLHIVKGGPKGVVTKFRFKLLIGEREQEVGFAP
jgi:hypothetical protein